MIKDFVEYIVKSLVDDPNVVTVACDIVDGQYQVMVSVATSDRGRIIGRNGETIRALRALISVIVPEAHGLKVEVAE
jgi:predicted RNA-binding protein YlqC (UPF0109 family)